MKQLLWATTFTVWATVGAQADFDWKRYYLMDPSRQDEVSTFNAINTVRFASDIAAYCKAGQQTVVPLTPKEQEWLDKVAPNGQLDYDDKRWMEVKKNSIYLRSRVLGYYDNCESWTDAAVLSQLMTLRSAIKAWGQLANLLFKYEFLIGDAVNTLRQRGEAVDQGMDRDLGTAFHLMVAASHILEALPSAETQQ